jgi:hypothetical protein
MHHPSTVTSRIAVRRLVFLALLGVLLALALAQAVPAFAAQRPDYTGGPVVLNNDGKTDFPLYVPNDYTVSALRFTVAGGTLYDVDNNAVTTAGVQYYVKIRLSPTPAPASTDNRGFTWNPASQTWVQEREDWTNFPVATTTTGGAITATNSSWYYFRFGDTAKAGTYYVLVSLQPVGGGSGMTQNNATAPAVTVLDMYGTIAGATDGFVIHNGVATGANGVRADATDSTSATTVWALTRTINTSSTAPLQTMPDRWTAANAVNGDFALGVPSGSAFDARVQNNIWPASAPSFTGPLADVNVALGASETTPPSAPASLTATPHNESADLHWGVATDDTGVTSYIVYRWTDPASTAYTALPEAIATTSELEYTDTGLTNGTAYHYAVRAMDAATNVGPRATADVTPDTKTTLELEAAPTVIAWNASWALSGRLEDVAGEAIPNASVDLQSSIDGGTNWATLQGETPAAGTSTYTDTIYGTYQKMQFRLHYAGDETHAESYSDIVTVTPKVKLGKPVAPSSVKKGARFTAYGSLAPKQSRNSKTVKIQCSIKKNGKWVLKKTVTATNANKGSATRYSAKFSLPAKGTWRLVAYSPRTDKYAKTTSGAEYLKAR